MTTAEPPAREQLPDFRGRLAVTCPPSSCCGCVGPVFCLPLSGPRWIGPRARSPRVAPRPRRDPPRGCCISRTPPTSGCRSCRADGPGLSPPPSRPRSADALQPVSRIRAHARIRRAGDHCGSLWTHPAAASQARCRAIRYEASPPGAAPPGLMQGRSFLSSGCSGTAVARRGDDLRSLRGASRSVSVSPVPPAPTRSLQADTAPHIKRKCQNKPAGRAMWVSRRRGRWRRSRVDKTLAELA
jgi:hypothetical protein